MAIDGVLDASVLAAAFFNENGSPEARAYLKRGPRLIAPDLLRLEIASIAAKKVWKGEASLEAGSRAVSAIDEFVITTHASDALIERVFALAATHRFSAYDAAYLALAEFEQAPVVTFDQKLIARAREAGLGTLVAHPD